MRAFATPPAPGPHFGRASEPHEVCSALFSVLVFAPLACGGPKADTATPEPAPAPAPAPVAKPAAKPIPDGFSLTPQLVVKNVDAAVDFYVKAFGATKVYSMPGPDGKAMHAEGQDRRLDRVRRRGDGGQQVPASRSAARRPP